MGDESWFRAREEILRQKNLRDISLFSVTCPAQDHSGKSVFIPCQALAPALETSFRSSKTAEGYYRGNETAERWMPLEDACLNIEPWPRVEGYDYDTCRLGQSYQTSILPQPSWHGTGNNEAFHGFPPTAHDGVSTVNSLSQDLSDDQSGIYDLSESDKSYRSVPMSTVDELESSSHSDLSDLMLGDSGNTETIVDQINKDGEAHNDDQDQALPSFLSPENNSLRIVFRVDKQAKPCSFCKQRKLKCSRVRPCGSCSTRKRGELCDASISLIEKADMASIVERPIQFRRILEFADSNGFATTMLAAKSIGVNHMLVRRLWENGLDTNHIMSMLVRMPPNVKQAINNGCDMMSNAYLKLLAKTKGKIAAPCPQSTMHGRSSLIFEDAEEEVLHVQQLIGHGCWLMVSFDPETGQRTRCSVGPDYSDSMLGIHSEEFMSRFALNDLCIPMTEIDAFCIVIHNMLTALEETNCIYIRCDRKVGATHTPFIRKHSMIREDDRWGRNIRLIFSYEVETPQSFDFMLEHLPEKVRPFSSFLGDSRKFAEIEERHKSDMQFRGKIVHWNKSSKNRKRLQEFGEHIRSLFEKATSKINKVHDSIHEKI
ncbi:hypothetical protein GUITHDRAFT_140318 [Guillardia theta CCMP2712]|uniref:Zn(2)-C6 fungal-type domain-containing protein n=2 Tax=Guillardia theta TaxID=55529 RepID=L1J4T5_GUITC|nr:hypothetical protein GUITHDRAFT_140318 [Guillardia theta CCMP2712]EKX43543.1 hypothetical protein GUITHDRAFT_140318 [Guillardia theta CCMP2712]|eukprot:XP_005830523.1 hypothetical protein GUITHDRAFT_140318 [Guillardia theta CCMP2712]